MKSLIEDIKTGNYKNVYLLYGEEEYLKQFYRDKLCKALIPEDDSMNISRFSGKGTSEAEIIDLGQTMPFFADKRVVLVEDSGYFKSASPQIADYVTDLPEYLVLLFVESEVDKRNKLYKNVTKTGRAVEFKKQDEKTLGKWVAGIFAKDGKKITQKDMEFFLMQTGTDMSNILNEAQKLMDYTMGREIITHEDIEEVTSGQVTNQIFDMIRAVSEKQQKKALDLYYDLLALKEPPMRILFLLARQYQQMLLAKTLLGQGYDQQQIAKKMGMQSFIVRNYCNYSRKYSIEELRQAVEDFVDAEEQVKTGRLTDRLSVELLIVKYSQMG